MVVKYGNPTLKNGDEEAEAEVEDDDDDDGSLSFKTTVLERHVYPAGQATKQKDDAATRTTQQDKRFAPLVPPFCYLADCGPDKHAEECTGKFKDCYHYVDFMCCQRSPYP
jgi:hypothetical protein